MRHSSADLIWQFKRNSRWPLQRFVLIPGMWMKFEQENYANLLVVRPESSRLDSIVAPEFRQSVIELAAEQNTLVIIDLINVEFMDSSGLGAVIGCYKATQGSGGLALCNLHDDVKEVFRLTHMDRIFEIHDDFDSSQYRQAA